MSKIERTLHVYGNIIVKVVTDEEMDDMEWAAVISDHGDEYLVVKTKDKKVYKYGCFANLKYYSFSNDWCLTKPVMYKDEPRNASTSNKIYEWVKDSFFERSWGFSDEIKKYHSKESAQWKFDWFLDKLNEIHETSKERYDSRRYHEDEIKRFLVKNEIATEENLEKLHNAPWDSRINGIDGVAGKVDISNTNCIDFDSLCDVYIVSKDDLEIVQADGDDDEYGFPTFYLNFEPDPELAAEKRLIEALGKKWQDYMHRDSHVNLTRSGKMEVDFERIYLDPKTGEASYLIIDKRGGRPKAAYMTLEEVVSQKNQMA